jgi:hypothetical protein
VRQRDLDQLSARSVGENPPSRHALVQEFCRRCKWFDPQGEPCVSSANIALNRLEKLGHVRLPPPQRRGPRNQPRKLVDDGQRLPALPKLPQSAGSIKNLHSYNLCRPRHWLRRPLPAALSCGASRQGLTPAIWFIGQFRRLYKIEDEARQAQLDPHQRYALRREKDAASIWVCAAA